MTQSRALLYRWLLVPCFRTSWAPTAAAEPTFPFHPYPHALVVRRLLPVASPPIAPTPPARHLPHAIYPPIPPWPPAPDSPGLFRNVRAVRPVDGCLRLPGRPNLVRHLPRPPFGTKRVAPALALRHTSPRHVRTARTTWQTPGPRLVRWPPTFQTTSSLSKNSRARACIQEGGMSRPRALVVGPTPQRTSSTIFGSRCVRLVSQAQLHALITPEQPRNVEWPVRERTAADSWLPIASPRFARIAREQRGVCTDRRPSALLCRGTARTSRPDLHSLKPHWKLATRQGQRNWSPCLRHFRTCCPQQETCWRVAKGWGCRLC